MITVKKSDTYYAIIFSPGLFPLFVYQYVENLCINQNMPMIQAFEINMDKYDTLIMLNKLCVIIIIIIYMFEGSLIGGGRREEGGGRREEKIKI